MRAPSFSLSTRYNIPSDVAMKPGPGAYMPEKVLTLLIIMLDEIKNTKLFDSNALFRLTPRTTNLNIVLVSNIPCTCLGQGHCPEKKHVHYHTNILQLP